MFFLVTYFFPSLFVQFAWLVSVHVSMHLSWNDIITASVYMETNAFSDGNNFSPRKPKSYPVGWRRRCLRLKKGRLLHTDTSLGTRFLTATHSQRPSATHTAITSDPCNSLSVLKISRRAYQPTRLAGDVGGVVAHQRHVENGTHERHPERRLGRGRVVYDAQIRVASPRSENNSPTSPSASGIGAQTSHRSKPTAVAMPARILHRVRVAIKHGHMGNNQYEYRSPGCILPSPYMADNRHPMATSDIKQIKV